MNDFPIAYGLLSAGAFVLGVVYGSRFRLFGGPEPTSAPQRAPSRPTLRVLRYETRLSPNWPWEPERLTYPNAAAETEDAPRVARMRADPRFRNVRVEAAGDD